MYVGLSPPIKQAVTQSQIPVGCPLTQFSSEIIHLEFPVLVTFLIAKTKYLTPKVKGRKVCLGQRIVDWLQGRVAEKKQLIVGTSKGQDKSLSVPYTVPKLPGFGQCQINQWADLVIIHP